MMNEFEEFAALEVDGWNDPEISTGYSTRFASASDMAIPAILSHVNEAEQVLDLCCGHGNVTRALNAAGYQVIGVDFAEAMLELARQQVPQVDFQRADAQDMPFAIDSFDAVVCSFGLMHVPDQPKALSEVNRVLRKGGVYVMTCWVGPDHSPAFKALFSAIAAHGAKDVSLPPSPDFHQFADPAVAQEMMQNAGLELIAHDQVDCVWNVATAEDAFDIFRNAAPRAGHLLRQQPKQNADNIRAHMSQSIAANYAVERGYSIPIPAVCLAARKL